MDETLKAAGGKVWTPDEPDKRPSFTISFTSTPPRKRDFLLMWWEDHWFKVSTIVLVLVVGLLTIPLYETFTNPVTAETEEGGLFISPELSPAAAVATVRDWVPQQDPFLLMPNEIKSVSLNDVTNGEPGFITLKDSTVIPFTIHNVENVVTVTPNNSVSLSGANNGE